jgi:hypothetical protein
MRRWIYYRRRELNRKLRQIWEEPPILVGKVEYLFIAINRTGGSSVSRAIGLTRKRHYTARELIDWIGRDRFDAAFTFAFVRNPWDRVVSNYYRQREGHERHQFRGAFPPFAEWVHRGYGDRDPPRYYGQAKMYWPQLKWLQSEEGEEVVDFVGRQERLDEDFARVAEIIGVPPELPRLNRSSRHRPYWEEYDPQTAEFVAERFRADIERFGYEFGPVQNAE